jgi:hypothetical protein
MQFDWRNPRAVLRWGWLFQGLFPWSLLFLIHADDADWPAWIVFGAWGSILLTLLGFSLWHPNSDRRVTKDLAALRRSWSWFAWRAVTIAPMPAPEQIEQAARPHGFRVIELDGRRLHSLADLSAALQMHTKPMRWPEEPLAHALALLRQIAMGTPRRTLLVWRHANASLAHDPIMLANVVAEHTAQSVLLPLGLLLFVDLQPVAVAAPTSVSDEPTEPSPHEVLAAAPESAWWKPQAGELAR